ncbi:MAG: archaellin/type IV pilin N-terminal domain-containing protein [Nitrososphaerales archaeon]
MKIVQSGKKRKAISPVLATVILIAITLIAAIAVAGFVFGLFGTFTSSANLTSQVVACNATGSGVALHVSYCTIMLTNTGGASASVTGCAIYGATSLLYTSAGTLPLAASGSIPVAAGTTTAVPVYAACLAANPGTAGAVVTGSLVVASGAPLAFSATYGN